MKNAFDLWFLGNGALGICPVKFWNPKDIYVPPKPAESETEKMKKFNEAKQARSRLSKWSRTMKGYEEQIKGDAEVYVAKNPTATEVFKMYTAAHNKIEAKVKPFLKRKRESKKRSPVVQYKWMVAAGIIKKKKKKPRRSRRN